MHSSFPKTLEHHQDSIQKFYILYLKNVFYLVMPYVFIPF